MKKYKKKRHIESFLEVKDKKYTFYYKKFNNLKNLKIDSTKKNNIWLLKSEQDCLLEKGPIKACLRTIQTIFRKFELSKKAKSIMCFIPDFVLTSKPKEVRMGKGKGKPSSKVALIKKGSTLFRLSNVPYHVAYIIEKQCRFRLPIKVNLIKNNW